MTIQVTGSCILFSDSTVQTTASAGKSPYITGVACCIINAGDPVSLICGCSGLAPTVGLGSPTTYLFACENVFCCNTCLCCSVFITAGTAASSDTSLLKFSDSCFVSLEVVTACNSGYCSIGGFACLRTHTIQGGGNIISACLCSLAFNCCVSGRSWVIPGCSGTTGAFLTPLSPCGTCLMETFLCYCNTTQTISLIRQCYGPRALKTYTSFVTPDCLYFVTFVVQSSPYGGYYGTCCNCPIAACGSWCVAAIVKQTTDSVCYLSNTIATSCTSLLNSVLPATCATWHAGSNCDVACCGSCCLVYTGFCSSSCLYCPMESSCCFANFAGGIAAARGFSPFTYGQDGWILMNFYVCGTTVAGTPCLGTCCPCQTLFKDTYFGFKPIGMDCYAITCNNIVPDRAGSTNTLLYYANRFCKSSILQVNADFGFMYDAGDCIKRQFITSNAPSFYTYCCACTASDGCGGYNILSSVQCSVCATNAGVGVVQCFCIGAGPCICFLGVTCCSASPDCLLTGTLGNACLCVGGGSGSSCAMGPLNIHGYMPYGGTGMTIKTYGTNPDTIENPTQLCYSTSPVCACFAMVCICRPCDNLVAAFGAKRAAYMAAAWITATPICIANGCYGLGMDYSTFLGCDTCEGLSNYTVGSIVNNPTALTLWISAGNPCTYIQCYGLGGCAGQDTASSATVFRFNASGSGFSGNMASLLTKCCSVVNSLAVNTCYAYLPCCGCLGGNTTGYGLNSTGAVIGGYNPNSIFAKSNNQFVAFTNYSGYYNCPLCSSSSGLQNPGYIHLQNIIGICFGYSSYCPGCTVYFPGCALLGCCQAGLTKNVLGTGSVVAPSVNLTQFIGIAQNSAGVGGSVCYAIPGSIDRSPFACCVFNNYGVNTTTVGWSAPWCCATYSSWQACGGNSVLLGGTMPYCCICSPFFTYYRENIMFIPFYDTSISQWVNQIQVHCRNALLCGSTWCCSCFT